MAAVFALMLGGCAGSLKTADGERLRLRSDEFRSYAEAVFRSQNRVATDIAFALEEPELYDDAAIARLETADQMLFEACMALNEMAARRRDQRGRRIFADARAARTVPQCERAAAAAIEALESMDPRGP